jgi:Family of unknown function (DUF6049)
VRRALALAASAFLALTGPALLSPATASAQAELNVRIELTGMSPRMVTADGPSVLVVSGNVTNGGDRVIRDLQVRVQRGEPLRSDADLRSALGGDAPTDSARPRFTNLPDRLPPGGSAPFTVQVPLRGGGPIDSLQLAEPGVYPLLVNLNGLPDFGGRARLAAVRLLLPVLGLPPQDTTPAVPGTPPAQSAPLTVLWPIVDVPHRRPTADGAAIVLRDDELATSLAPGGRLYGLVHAALDTAPAGSALADSMCLAVDPDLVDTVRLMAERNYQMPDGAGGKGQVPAQEWLRDLRQLAAGRCLLALPMADVDLVALSRAGLTDLEGRARTDGAQILRDVLSVAPRTDVTWPAGEVLDERTLTDLASLGSTAVVIDPRGLNDDPQAPLVGLTTGAPATATQRGILVDALAGQALSGPPPSPALVPDAGTPSVIPSTTPAGAAQPLAAQDGLAVLAYRATEGNGMLLAPPRRWDVTPAEAAEFLSAAGRLLGDGWVRPRPLAELTQGATRATATLNYPTRAQEIPSQVIATATTVRDQLRDLEAATKRDPRVGYEPARLLDPMRFGLLRGTSTAWRDNPAMAAGMVALSRDRLAELRASVQIVPPGGPYLLAASNSPLLLNLNNPLPVQIDVRITLSQAAGLRTAPIEVTSLPAGSRRQVRVPAEVIRAGQFSVEARLSTPGGTSLGPRASSRIQLRSTAYGTVTLLLTGGAAVSLVLLSALRITRRVRAARNAEKP